MKEERVTVSRRLLASLCRFSVTGNCCTALPRSRRTIFSIFCHGIPSGNDFIVTTKLTRIIRTLRGFRFASSSVDCLHSLGLFSTNFLSCLTGLGFSYAIQTVPRKAPIFPHRPVLAIGKPLLRYRLLRAFMLGVLGRRSLVTAGSQQVYTTTRNHTIVRFNTQQTRKPSTSIFNTETTMVNKYADASGYLTTGGFNLRTTKAVTRD